MLTALSLHLIINTPDPLLKSPMGKLSRAHPEIRQVPETVQGRESEQTIMDCTA